APFHRQRNGIDDAIIFEVYAEQVANGRGQRFCFVTHNTKDFSEPNGDSRKPHPDLASQFSRVKSLYFTSLAEALRRIEPALVTDYMVENEWIFEPRPYSEIWQAIDELTDKVWYNRHKVTEEKIERGIVKLVNEYPPLASLP